VLIGTPVFIADEVHATGILGPKGAGLVSQLSVEKDISMRLHTPLGPRIPVA
jgi:8-amino-7-oxononanoate synthase